MHDKQETIPHASKEKKEVNLTLQKDSSLLRQVSKYTEHNQLT